MSMTRRTALAAVAALPATVVALPSPALAIDRTAWEQALADWRRVDSQSNALWEAYEAADEQLPTRPEHLEALGPISCKGERGEILRDILFSLCQRDFGAGGYPLYPPEAKAEYEAHLRRLNLEADKLTDDAVAWRQHWNSERQRLRVDELYSEASAHRDEAYFAARDKVANTPAPDTAALLIKMEMAADFDSEEYMRLALEDARRLLSVH